MSYELRHYIMLDQNRYDASLNGAVDQSVFILFLKGSNGVAVVRTLSSHQCGPGSNLDVDAICGFSLLFVFSFAPRVFFTGYFDFPLSPKTTVFKFQFYQKWYMKDRPVDVLALNLFINSVYLFIYLFLLSLQEAVFVQY